MLSPKVKHFLVNSLVVTFAEALACWLLTLTGMAFATTFTFGMAGVLFAAGYLFCELDLEGKRDGEH